MNNTTPIIGILMGSNSDWPIMKNAADILEQFGVAFEAKVVSAHRMPDDMFAYAETAQSRGIRAIIAGAGGAAHLPGMLAAKTIVPVFGVPVATFAIGEAGAANSALHAIANLAMTDAVLAQKLHDFRAQQYAHAAGMVLG